MPKDHYLPASFIGGFSSEDKKRLRDRGLWVSSIHRREPQYKKASTFGCVNGLYGTDSYLESVDSWTYENDLPIVLKALSVKNQLPLSDWIHVAVPFVAGLFIRGNEFAKRYENNPLIKNLIDNGMVPKSNTNFSRLIRMQRMLAPIMSARWTILHGSASVKCISNDIGLTGMIGYRLNDAGWAIPIGPHAVLALLPLKEKPIACYGSDAWIANIEHIDYPDGLFEKLNESIALSAHEFIYGQNREEIARLESFMAEKKPEELAYALEEPWNSRYSGKALVAHELDWYAVASISDLNLNPAQAAKHDWSFSDLDQTKWSPMPFFGANILRFDPGLRVIGDCLLLNTEEPSNFEDHIISPLPLDSKGEQ